MADSTHTMHNGALTWWYRQPASRYWDGLPLGTGRLAGMIHGPPSDEQVTINDETLWSGGPYNPVVRDGRDTVARLRGLVLSGQYHAADDEAMKLVGRPAAVQQYQAMCALHLVCGHKPDDGSYRRELDMRRGLVRTTYRIGPVSFLREAFASYTDQVIVIRLQADLPGRLSLKLVMKTLQPVTLCESEAPDGHSGQIRLSGRATAVSRTGQRSYEEVIPAAVTWSALLSASCRGGSVQAMREADGTACLQVMAADDVVLVLGGATNVVSWQDVSANAEQRCRDWVSKACARTYDALKQRHLDDYIPLFSRFSLRLDQPEPPVLDTAERLVRLRQGQTDLHLLVQYVQYARYLLLAAARPGTLAYNNHNIWLDNLEGKWRGRWTLNINLQACYWPVDLTGLPECMDSLLGFVRQLAVSGQRTARTAYGLDGWCAHHGTDVWMNTAPQDVAPWHAIFPTAGAWLCHQLFDHYLFTQDKAFLKILYPLMRGAARFCQGLLIEIPGTGYLAPCPSTSPENRFVSPQDGRPAAVSAGSSIDVQIIRSLFRDCLKAQMALDCDAAFGNELLGLLDRLPPHQIGRNGQLQEWLTDFTECPDEVTHRHLSHLYALYPDDDLTCDSPPALLQAARSAIRRRGRSSLGWSAAWQVNLLARLGEGDSAWQLLEQAIAAVSLHPSCQDSAVTPSFEGNQAIQGLAAGVAEMLVQSHGGVIRLLPALPAAWRSGSVTGLQARGKVMVDLDWSDATLSHARLLASQDGAIQLQTNRPVTITCAGQILDLAPTGQYRYLLTVQAGQVIELA